MTSSMANSNDYFPDVGGATLGLSREYKYSSALQASNFGTTVEQSGGGGGGGGVLYYGSSHIIIVSLL